MYSKSFILTEPERAVCKVVAIKTATTVKPILDSIKAQLKDELNSKDIDKRVLKTMLEFTIEEIIKHNG